MDDIYDTKATDPTIVAYTDGACLQNPGGRSGASAILHFVDGSGHTEAHSRGYLSSTSQRAELLGLLMALEAVGPSDHILVRSDSRYAIDGLRRHRHAPAFRLPTANRDLWIRIQVAARIPASVSAEWIKGHNGDVGNEGADHLAGEAARFGPWVRDVE